MKPFTQVSGVAAPLPRADVDTDAVIPVPWMKAIEPDYAKALFANWRWKDGDGINEIPEFVLNRPPFREACILVAGTNFGCGSSREAAVWALLGFGIRCVIAPSFGDIFHENSYKNGLLPLVLPEAQVEALLKALAQGVGGSRMKVDLEAQVVTAPDGSKRDFKIDASRRSALLAGLDEVGVTLAQRDAIAAFQARDRELRPWIYQPPLDRPITPNEGRSQ
jgi:3-isopropylmalate/(R)-2-methylmalate dehydratase small subunit